MYEIGSWSHKLIDSASERRKKNYAGAAVRLYVCFVIYVDFLIINYTYVYLIQLDTGHGDGYRLIYIDIWFWWLFA